MKQIRIHGRGGQGVVTAAELIALAAFYEGKYSQAFPHFGVERTGAPIQSFARIHNKKIITREQIYKPDVLIIQDASLINTVDVFQGIHRKTKVIINAPQGKEMELKLKTKKKNIYFSPATDIALEIFGKNIVNTVILGTFAKKTKLISLDSLKKAVKKRFEDKGKKIIEKNLKAVELAYEE